MGKCTKSRGANHSLNTQKIAPHTQNHCVSTKLLGREPHHVCGIFLTWFSSFLFLPTSTYNFSFCSFSVFLSHPVFSLSIFKTHGVNSYSITFTFFPFPLPLTKLSVLLLLFFWCENIINFFLPYSFPSSAFLSKDSHCFLSFLQRTLPCKW